MHRIMIIGSQGSGKSTFAVKLGEMLKREVIHLDNIYHLGGGRIRQETEWNHIQEELVKMEKWILDGTYPRTWLIRLKRADTVIFLDKPMPVNLYRTIKRWWTYRYATRPELRQDISERLEWRMIKKILFFPRRGILDELAEHKDKKIYIFKNDKQAEDFLNNLLQLSA